MIRLALLFHDIAKPLTFEKDSVTGQTKCPHHDVRGSLIAMEAASAFGLPHGAVRTVAHLVLLGNPEIVCDTFQGVVADLYIPLLLISRCDAEGSDLPTLDPEGWTKRAGVIDVAIDRFSRTLE